MTNQNSSSLPSVSFSLAGQTAAITGAGSGIGKATALCFAAAGANVVVIDLNESQGQSTVDTIVGAGGTAQLKVCDVADAASVATAFADLKGLNLLVNCAGVSHIGNLLGTGAEDFDRLYRINVRGTYLVMQAAVGLMVQNGGGAVVNLASIAATAGLADRFAYSMTKGAVVSMTLSAARDYVGQGVRINCISPARVHTPFVDAFLAKNYPGKEEEMMKKLAASQPIGRMASPHEVATLALFLCSKEASFITGCDYPLDGGFFNLHG